MELSKWVGTREPTPFTTALGRVGLKCFYKFQYGLIFDLVLFTLRGLKVKEGGFRWNCQSGLEPASQPRSPRLWVGLG